MPIPLNKNTILAFLCCLMVSFSSLAVSQPPNILLILSDDHGAEDSGSYGNAVIKTPNIDQLAAGGLQFNRAFAAEAICAPSRSSVYTGLYPMRHGAHRNHTQIKPAVKTLR